MVSSGKMSRRKQPRPYRLQDDEDSRAEGKNSICENPLSLVNLLNGNGAPNQNRKLPQKIKYISISNELLSSNGELYEPDVAASPLTAELTKTVFYACSVLC